MKITVYDKFKNVADSTPWAKISVKYTESPMFEKIEPSQIVIGESGGELVIRGDNFTDTTTVEIQGPPEISIQKMSVISEEEITVKIDPEKAEPGLYSIILSNGDNKSVMAKNVLKLKNTAVDNATPVSKVEILSISPSMIIPPLTTTMTVKGKKFYRDAKVFVSQDGVEYPAVTKFISDSELVVEIPSDKLKLGKCDLILRQGKLIANYSGVPVSIPNDGLIGLGGVNIAAGYSGFALMGDWAKYFKSSNKGFNFYLGRHFYKASLLKGMTTFGLECDAASTSFEHKKNSSKWKSELSVLQNRLGFYVSQDIINPLSVIFRIDGGLAYSKLSVKYLDKTDVKKSYDSLVSLGTSIKYSILKSFFVEGGADMSFIMYKSSRMNGVRYFARAGLIL
jgi:hypothetical protein